MAVVANETGSEAGDNKTGSLAPASSDGRSALEVIFDATMDPIETLSVVRDDQGQIIDFRFEDANPALCAESGRSRHELIGGRLTELFPLVSRRLLGAFAAVVETGTPLVAQAAEIPSALRGGAVRMFDLRAVPSGDGLMVSFRDVTAFAEQSERLRQSERLYRLVSQNTHDLVLTFSGEVIQWASPSTQDLLGYTPEELIGRRWSSFSYADGRDLQALHEANHGDARAQGRTRVRAKDGSPHWISVALGPNYDDYGNRIGTLVSASLADREVAAETEINALLTQRGRILEHVPVGVFRLSVREDGRVERDYINRRSLELLAGHFACPLSSVIVGNELSVDDLAHLTTSARSAMRSGSPLVCVQNQPDGRWVRIEAHAEEEPGGVVVLDGIAEDVTLAKAHEAELEAEANAATALSAELANSLAFKSAVLSAVGHDLRTPLAVLSTSASALSDTEHLGAAERAELLANVQQSALTLEKLLTDLLDAQRIDVGAVELRPDSVDLWEILEDGLRNLPSGVELSIPSNFPPIDADAGLLSRVLDNLLRNAALHSDSERPVQLVATRVGDDALIKVVDHGVGVPEEQFARMFEPFHRLQDDHPGSGFGLWIAHQFARAMGMTLTPMMTPGGGLTMTLKARFGHGAAAHR